MTSDKNAPSHSQYKLTGVCTSGVSVLYGIGGQFSSQLNNHTASNSIQAIRPLLLSSSDPNLPARLSSIDEQNHQRVLQGQLSVRAKSAPPELDNEQIAISSSSNLTMKIWLSSYDDRDYYRRSFGEGN